MKSAIFLQRCLLKLESTIKLPDPQEIWKQIQVKTLSELSIEDLHALCDIVERQTTGIAIEDTPENNGVIQRSNAAIAAAHAEYDALVGIDTGIPRPLPAGPDGGVWRRFASSGRCSKLRERTC
jgi:hypothetical protein